MHGGVAVITYNTRTPFYKLHKKVVSSSPGTYAKTYEMSTKRKAERKFDARKIKPRAKRSLVLGSIENNLDYGPQAQKHDLEETMFQLKVEEHSAKLRKTPDEIAALERSTASQSDCYEWFEERRSRLTASNFGLICKRKPYSSCVPVVNKLLYSNVDCAATRYGKTHEDDAIQELEKSLKITVKKCGLFVNKKIPWLAASPDGLVDDDGIVEVKCPLSGLDLTPKKLIEEKRGSVGTFGRRTKMVNTRSKSATTFSSKYRVSYISVKENTVCLPYGHLWE